MDIARISRISTATAPSLTIQAGSASSEHLHGHARAGSRLVGRRPQVTIDVAREQRRLEDVVADVQASFAALGVRELEGNGPVIARFNPRYPNASYAPAGIPEKGVPADSITVGVDPRSMRSFAEAEDVVAHELAHRIIDHMTNGKLELSPLSEDVAVHESLADTLAAMVDTDDWVIGDQLAAPIRVMNNPEAMGHPGHIDDVQRVFGPGSEYMRSLETRDGRAVLVPDWHVLAGIPNKAASMIGDSLGRATMGEIYLKAAREYVQPGQKIEGLALATLASAKDLYGAQSREFQATRDAWDAVGVLDLLVAAANEQPRA